MTTNSELLEALRPFAELASDDFAGTHLHGKPDHVGHLHNQRINKTVTLGDFRRAVRLVRLIDGQYGGDVA